MRLIAATVLNEQDLVNVRAGKPLMIAGTLVYYDPSGRAGSSSPPSLVGGFHQVTKSKPLTDQELREVKRSLDARYQGAMRDMRVLMSTGKKKPSLSPARRASLKKAWVARRKQAALARKKNGQAR